MSIIIIELRFYVSINRILLLIVSRLIHYKLCIIRIINLISLFTHNFSYFVAFFILFVLFWTRILQFLFDYLFVWYGIWCICNFSDDSMAREYCVAFISTINTPSNTFLHFISIVFCFDFDWLSIDMLFCLLEFSQQIMEKCIFLKWLITQPRQHTVWMFFNFKIIPNRWTILYDNMSCGRHYSV